MLTYWTNALSTENLELNIIFTALYSVIHIFSKCIHAQMYTQATAYMSIYTLYTIYDQLKLIINRDLWPRKTAAKSGKQGRSIV